MVSANFVEGNGHAYDETKVGKKLKESGSSSDGIINQFVVDC